MMIYLMAILTGGFALVGTASGIVLRSAYRTFRHNRGYTGM